VGSWDRGLKRVRRETKDLVEGVRIGVIIYW
jgi:hypothetical protein